MHYFASTLIMFSPNIALPGTQAAEARHGRIRQLQLAAHACSPFPVARQLQVPVKQERATNHLCPAQLFRDACPDPALLMSECMLCVFKWHCHTNIWHGFLKTRSNPSSMQFSRIYPSPGGGGMGVIAPRGSFVILTCGHDNGNITCFVIYVLHNAKQPPACEVDTVFLTV